MINVKFMSYKEQACALPLICPLYLPDITKMMKSLMPSLPVFLYCKWPKTALQKLLKWPRLHVTAVSGSIEQVDSLIKEIWKHNYTSSINSLIIQRASRTLVCCPTYTSSSAAMFVGLSVVALWSLMKLWGGWWMIIVFGILNYLPAQWTLKLQ